MHNGVASLEFHKGESNSIMHQLSRGFNQGKQKKQIWIFFLATPNAENRVSCFWEWNISPFITLELEHHHCYQMCWKEGLLFWFSYFKFFRTDCLALFTFTKFFFYLKNGAKISINKLKRTWMGTYVVSDKRHIWGVICSLIASTTIEGFPILTSVNLQDSIKKN